MFAAATLLGCAAAASAGDDNRIALFQPRTSSAPASRRALVVALTFDDGPNKNTPAVLDALKAMNVKATFFIVGKFAKRTPDVLADRRRGPSAGEPHRRPSLHGRPL